MGRGSVEQQQLEAVEKLNANLPIGNTLSGDGVADVKDAEIYTDDQTGTVTGLVSLAINLGLDGSNYDTFYFSAPGDDLQLEMSGMEESFRDKSQLTGGGLAILLALFVGYWLIVKINKLRRLVMIAGSILALGGLANVAYGFLPIYAAMLLVAGLMWAYSGYARKEIVVEP